MKSLRSVLRLIRLQVLALPRLPREGGFLLGDQVDGVAFMFSGQLISLAGDEPFHKVAHNGKPGEDIGQCSLPESADDD